MLRTKLSCDIYVLMITMLEMQRSLLLKDVSSYLYVGGYLVTVTVSLVLYYVTSFMDPGYVPIVNLVYCCYKLTDNFCL